MRLRHSKIINCSRSGHLWGDGGQAICRRCGLHLKVMGKHWQMGRNSALWERP